MKFQGVVESVIKRIIPDYNEDKLVTVYSIRWFLQLFSIIKTTTPSFILMIAERRFSIPIFLDEETVPEIVSELGDNIQWQIRSNL